MRLEVEQRGQREGDMRSEKHQGDIELASEATLRTQLLGQGNGAALGGGGGAEIDQKAYCLPLIHTS